MKVLIVSDTHGKENTLDEVLLRETPFDVLIHCGDVEGQEDYLEAALDCPAYIVAGNNDFFSDLPREEELWLGDYRVMLTHGHYYGVSMGTSRLEEEARARGFDIAMYGHTHRPELKIEDDLTVLNPGSISYPRQWGHEPSFILMEIDRDGQAHYTINYLK